MGEIWRPPRESVGIQQSPDNTCFTCGKYVAPNEGAYEHEFDSVVCPSCVRHTTAGDYRTSAGSGKMPDGSWKFKWARGKNGKGRQEKEDPEAYFIGKDLRFSGHGEQG